MAGLTGKTPKVTYKDLLQVDNSNSGLDGTPRAIKDGEGVTSALKVSTDEVEVSPVSDSTTAFRVANSGDTEKLLVDTTNSYVKALGYHVNTQYAHFGTMSTDAIPSSADTHTAIPFGNVFGSNTEVTFGTSTDPATSLTISTTADDVLCVIWYVPDNITVDAVHVWAGGSASTGDTIKFHLMSYTIVTADGVTCGDLSSGTVIADGANITHDGYEQADYQLMTIQSSDIDAGKAVLFMIHSNGTNSDYTCNATVKYHLR